jgi:hypothetical protein
VAISLHLDHVTLSVPALREATEHLDARLGLRTTLSRPDPGRHGRLYLDRAYLEVSAGDTGGGWSLSHFFLRFEDPAALRHHLQAEGVPCRFGDYVGVDGRWDDVELDGDDVPLPILVRRTEPPEVASDWPPALGRPHRCGARTLHAVHIAVPELASATQVYGRLLGSLPEIGVSDAGAPYACFSLASGRIVLSPGPGCGVSCIVLGVSSFVESARVVGPLSNGPVAWLDEKACRGVRIGMCEI